MREVAIAVTQRMLNWSSSVEFGITLKMLLLSHFFPKIVECLGSDASESFMKNFNQANNLFYLQMQEIRGQSLYGVIFPFSFAKYIFILFHKQ